MAVSSIDLPKASRVSIAGVAHVNDLGGIIDFFCVNQSETVYTFVLVMPSRVALASIAAHPAQLVSPTS